MSDIDKTLSERGNRYGDFRNHGAISQRLKQVMISTPGWANMNHYQREALEMIQHKIARILNGDPNYDDSWRDIAGYARLVEKELTDGR